MREALGRIQCEGGVVGGSYGDAGLEEFTQRHDQPTATGYPKGLSRNGIERGAFESHQRAPLVRISQLPLSFTQILTSKGRPGVGATVYLFQTPQARLEKLEMDP